MLYQLDRLGWLRPDFGRLRDFMLAASRLLAPLLPPAAEEWLQVADRYRQNEASVAELERVRITAWEFLGKDSCKFDSPEVLAVRAVLCLLYPDDDEDLDDPFEVVHFFLRMSNRAADHQSEQIELLRRLFPDSLGEGADR